MDLLLKNRAVRALACFGRSPALLGHGDALQGELEPITTIFGTVDDLFDVQEHFRIVQLLTKLLEEGMDLGKDEIHFATDGREKEQVGIESAALHEGCRHTPVTGSLAQPIVFLAAEVHGYGHELVGTVGPKLCDPPVARPLRISGSRRRAYNCMINSASLGVAFVGIGPP